MKLFMMSLLALWLASACSLGGVNLTRNEDGSLNVSVALTEADVTSIVASALANSPQPVLRNVSVDLQNGQMVIAGTHDRPDGSGPVDGTLTATAAVTGGQLAVTVTSLNIAGYNTDDAALQGINQQLAAGLSARGTQSNQGAQLTNVVITDNALTITLRVQGS